LTERVKLGLVLGAGGVVGMNYHAGALHALAEEAGFDPDAAELVVGTSAGSIIGALLRSGWTTGDCWAFSQGTHPLVAELDEAERARRAAAVFTPRFTSPVDLARLTMGSAYVLARALVRTPVPMPPPAVARYLARRFPGGIFSTADTKARLAEVLPETWPAEALWLVAVDIDGGRRVVLGRPGAPEATLHEAVLASCAIPGVYPPVRAGGLTLVDGGAHSSTNLDLAAKAGCEVIVGVAPMAFDPADPPARGGQVARRVPTRALHGETRLARRRGADVLLVRPSAAEVGLHGHRLMRPADAPAVARAAYEATARLVGTPRFQRVLGALAA
jgi:NTE family protein